MAILIDKELRNKILKTMGYPVIPISEEEILPKNLIIYGAPGTGKSRFLDDYITEYFSDDRLYTRITFHPNYSYSQFIGTYKPVPIYKETSGKLFTQDLVDELEHEPLIDYQFVPGPFIEMLCKAIKYPKSNFLLLIEEINRVNVASVFGDVFQLLDRENGMSKYPVTFNPDVMNYIRRQKGVLKKLKSKDRIQIPSNLYIWATMNSSDQGVSPMDAAFKRRWSFKYMPLNEKQEKTSTWSIKFKFHDKLISWNKLRKAINDRLKNNVAEDKLLGPFFLKKEELPGVTSKQSEHDIFINKLILYLKEDILRHFGTDEIFIDGTLSEIIEKYNQGNENIFKFSLSELEQNQLLTNQTGNLGNSAAGEGTENELNREQLGNNEDLEIAEQQVQELSQNE
ncbi:AAA family ATPase [Bacillus cereus]|uniref:AAA family ATPase n=1 Tax=Bacillus cereus TaxID=1396 RepID=UPI00364444FE